VKLSPEDIRETAQTKVDRFNRARVNCHNVIHGSFGGKDTTSGLTRYETEIFCCHCEERIAPKEGRLVVPDGSLFGDQAVYHFDAQRPGVLCLKLLL
jgi:hypothetical protein